MKHTKHMIKGKMHQQSRQLPVCAAHGVAVSGGREQRGPCQMVQTGPSSAACEPQMDP